MRTNPDNADHPRTTTPAEFIAARCRTWLDGDDGTVATLPAVLSRQICPYWIADDGRLLPELGQETPTQLAIRFHSWAFEDPLDQPRNHYPTDLLDDMHEKPIEIIPKKEFPVGYRSLGRADLYFIGAAEGPIKIGVSINPVSRLRALQTGYPFKLDILALVAGGGRYEGDYHAMFAEHRLHGEWFARVPEIEAEIAKLNEAAS